MTVDASHFFGVFCYNFDIVYFVIWVIPSHEIWLFKQCFYSFSICLSICLEEFIWNRLLSTTNWAFGSVVITLSICLYNFFLVELFPASPKRRKRIFYLKKKKRSDEPSQVSFIVTGQLIFHSLIKLNLT